MFGAWFDLNDARRICPIEQAVRVRVRVTLTLALTVNPNPNPNPNPNARQAAGAAPASAHPPASDGSALRMLLGGSGIF